MGIDYKKELEQAAKSMILVHDLNTLIKMIVRIIVRKTGVSHAGILLHQKERNSYVLTDSQGVSGLRVPTGFARMDADNPLIRFFSEGKQQDIFKAQALVYDKAKKISLKRLNASSRQLLKKALYQMEVYEASVCIPSYFRNDLLGLLLLGGKKNRKGFTRKETDFFLALASDVSMAIRNAELFRDLALELDKKQRLFINTANALAAAIDAKDHYTHRHTGRVTSFSLEIAKRLAKKNKRLFDKKFFEHLQIAGLLHDIGKIGIPESILNKNGPLDDKEWEKMKRHTLVGASILEPIQELEDAILGVKYHHENYDGSGYPEGLRGEQIPLIASIIAVADTFDAMTTDRPYRQSFSKEDAIQEIERVSGKQLNPEIASVLIELCRENKI